MCEVQKKKGRGKNRSRDRGRGMTDANAKGQEGRAIAVELKDLSSGVTG
jgi:hypothetical protein